jgi:hypothetical protein
MANALSDKEIVGTYTPGFTRYQDAMRDGQKKIIQRIGKIYYQLYFEG